MATATLVDRTPVGGALHRVRLAVDRALASTHAFHAQYLDVRHDGFRQHSEATVHGAVKGTFVLASAPGASTWELLVKEGGAMADRLLALPPGSELAVTAAQGKGFPFDAARGQPLVCAVTGSGVAAVLSAITARIEEKQAASTYLLYGVRQRSDVALRHELDAMRAAGVDVAVCLSREHVDEPGFYRGYVQQVAGERGWSLSGGRIFAAGNKAMIEAMRQVMPSLGLRAEDVVLNF
ncbi:MAG: hypothetical protein NVSMB47_10550 [Polyangiales bacterium]